MATSTVSNFKIYNPQFQAGMWEGIAQVITAFNAASQNAVRLVSRAIAGDYEKEAFFQQVSMVSRRDITSTSAATAIAMTQDENISVKVDRKIGPAEILLNAARRIGMSWEEASYIIGVMAGEQKAKDLLNTGLLAVEAAIEGQGTSLTYDATGQTTKTLITTYLVEALAKMGDAAGRVVAWVMHSKPFFDLTKSQITDKITNVADAVIYGASPGTLNRPCVVLDAPALTDANGSATDTYNILGLVANGVVVTESEQSEIVSEIVTGGENLKGRYQGEYAFNLACKGFKWDTTNGGTTPTDASLATTTNWDKVAASVKDCAGVRIVVQ